MSIKIKTNVEITAEICFNECELRALDALAGYGIEQFLEVFYSKLGTHYMKPYERNLRELFIKINQTVPDAIKSVEDVRKQLNNKVIL